MSTDRHNDDCCDEWPSCACGRPGKVFVLKPGQAVGRPTVVQGLRNIAQAIEDGEYGQTDQVTVVFPGASEIHHLGGLDSEAGASALFNCACAITRITTKVIEGANEV